MKLSVVKYLAIITMSWKDENRMGQLQLCEWFLEHKKITTVQAKLA